MATLIIGTKSDGTLAGRCNARCYNATGSACKCICAGMNHGKGFSAAIRSTSFTVEIINLARPVAHVLFPHTQYPLFKEETTC